MMTAAENTGFGSGFSLNQANYVSAFEQKCRKDSRQIPAISGHPVT